MIIGLHGVARVGKDAIASYLVKDYGYTRVALADAVRDAVYVLNPLIPWRNYAIPCTVQEAVDAFGWDEVKSTPEGRRLLQVMGTEIGRQMFGERVWLDIATRKIEEIKGPVVVTDIRFPNELDWLRNFDAVAVKVTRPGFGPINAHPSDLGIPDYMFDWLIDNDGSLHDLEHQIEDLVDYFGRPHDEDEVAPW